MNIEIILKLTKLEYCWYYIEKSGETIKLKSRTFFNYCEEEMSILQLHKDILELGKKLYLIIEECNKFKEVTRKKTLNIESAESYYRKNNTIDYNSSKAYIFGIIYHLNNKHNNEINNALLEFVKKYGVINIPDDIDNGIHYFLDNPDMEDFDSTINNLVYVSLLTYIYTKINNVIGKNHYEQGNSSKCPLYLKKFFGNFITSINYIEYIKSYINQTINKLYNDFFYRSSLMEQTIEKVHYIKTNSVLLAELCYLYKNQGKIYYTCFKCKKETGRLTRHLCDSCYDDDPNFYDNYQRKKRYKEINNKSVQLHELNNPNIEKILSSLPYYNKNTGFFTKDPNKKTIEIVGNLYNQYIKRE